MRGFLQGFLLGLIIVLPGMSGGTVFVILGIYEDMLRDFVKLNLKPYITMLAGLILGILASGMLFALVFETFRDQSAVFLMGCLLASTRAVIKSTPGLTTVRVVCLVVGLISGVLMGGDPMEIVHDGAHAGWFLLLVGGALASAAMMIPGVPGSSVLIVFGMYDSMLYYLKVLQWGPLILFGIGSLLGILLLANLLNTLYQRYRPGVSYFFAGLIVGSARVLLPYSFTPSLIPLFLAGFILVWIWSNGKKTESEVKLGT